MRKVLVSLFALILALCLSAAVHAQSGWVYLGEVHIDGQHDHDGIKIGAAAGRYRFLQLRLKFAPIEVDHIVVHYGNGEPQTLEVRVVIRAGSSSRLIPLDGSRIVQGLELWYSKPKPSSARPEVRLWAKR